MIANVLESIVKDLNQFLTLKYDLNDNVVVLTAIVNQDGSIPLISENKIICALIGIEQDRTALNYSVPSVTKKNPPINLNLHILLAANFHAGNYVESLRLMSGVLAFFQGKSVFTNKNTPNLALSKTTATIAPIEFRELTHLWGALGAKYMPSIVYKVRMLSIDQDRLLQEVPLITGTNPQANVE